MIAVHLQQLGDSDGMDGTISAESNQRRFSWVTSSLCGYGFDRADHSNVGNHMGCQCRVLQG